MHDPLAGQAPPGFPPPEFGHPPSPLPPAATEEVGVKQFRSASAAAGTAPVEFRIDGESFYATPVIPAAVMAEILPLARTGTEAERLNALSRFLDTVLYQESAERLAARMRSPEEPLTLAEVAEVLQWLLEEVYALRPSAPSSPSPGG